VESKETFADIVPDGPTEKAKWDIGGLQLQIRMSFGLIKMPVTKLEDVVKSKDAKKAEGTAPTDTTAAPKPLEKPVENVTPDEKVAPGSEAPASEVPASDAPAAEAAGKETAPAAKEAQPKAE